MILGIDGNEANVAQRVGVSWYVYYLLRELKKRSGETLEVRIFLRESPRSDLPSPSSHFRYVVVGGSFLWSQIWLPMRLFFRERDLDVFLSPAHYAPRLSPVPTVVVVHDLSFFYYPDNFLRKDLLKLKKWTGYSVRRAKRVVAVSRTTADDLSKLYGIPREGIEIVYNGYEPVRIPEVRPQFGVSKPFFLYIGTLQPRKNLVNLILAFEKFTTKHKNRHFLYIVGKKGWLYDEIFDLVKTRKLEDKVFFTDYLNEGEKQYLLKRAEALVVPGYYEGFGLPVLEAFAAGTPVIASQSGAIPEIADQAALYFNPADVNELAARMAEIDKLGSALRKKGAERLKRYSWQKTAREIMEICAKC